MTTFICWLIAIFLRPVQLGLAYEVLRHYFTALPVLTWLQVWAVSGVLMLSFYRSGKTDDGDEKTLMTRLEKASIAMLVRVLFGTGVTAIIWAVVT